MRRWSDGWAGGEGRPEHCVGRRPDPVPPFDDPAVFEAAPLSGTDPLNPRLR